MAQPVQPQITTCYRHPDRKAGVSCQRCDRPICPSCMVQASVGFHCPECTKQAAKSSPTISVRSLDAQPLVTQVLIGLNVLAFVGVLATGGTLLGGGGTLSDNGDLISFDHYSLVPRMAADGVAGGEWYRLVTNGFLHVGIIHLALNMLVLWLIGTQLERVLGHVRFLAIYVVSLLAGSFAVLLVTPGVSAVGASGAIFGLLGAMFAFQRDRGLNPMQTGLGGLIILNLVITFSIPGIAIGAHIGGLIGGFVAGWLMFQLERRTTSIWPSVAVCAGMSVVFVIGGVLAANRFLANYSGGALGL